ncbi:alpha-L-fucosidase [Paraflavitalea sp. CAU 1676]|uniref:alpha-L-fucosidase n=1 Tax=Paraflavitalea sp. CAU 1676 TaxID=3032598 RepID=UPI0023DA50F6|nr:alpha-L-fucosidase [Paraflavitalea sp. CAU 1676]MDF2193507.1 alpha-L-fucosidase [Paraflavitalea sp. CAU 1676]
MPVTRRYLLKNLSLSIGALPLAPSVFGNTNSSHNDLPAIQPGPFTGSRASLRKYQIPDWFRDAKFGIWAHWGPQSAIEAGDWYARNMYLEGSRQYKYHVERYGHPSKFGFKDTIPAWKAENFDADYLMSLYKKAGAKYFMALGVHHDNFDLWNSKHNKWNSVKMGPRKDIVGQFRNAARKHDLRFGISDHLWVTYKWFSSSKGSDQQGPFAGVPYDGANPANFDLYGTCEEVFNKRLDWNENGIPDSWKKHWFSRIKDLVDQYEPDLLYCDGHMPFEEYGLNMLAHLYNKSAAKHGGLTQAVYTSKRAEDTMAGSGICVFDVERGVVDNIWPLAWQTDTCIGDWHYNKERVGHYKSAKTVVDLLVDIVSRNGNLMLSIPLPASGMPDADELAVLEGIRQWMAVNSEGIYGTRPWKIFGDGPRTAVTKNDKEVNSAQQFNERNRKDFTHEDVRFTTKGNTLYAFFMGWPQGESHITIKALGTQSAHATGTIEKVEMLGRGSLVFTRDEQGLKVMLPAESPSRHACTLKISGNNLI